MHAVSDVGPPQTLWSARVVNSESFKERQVASLSNITFYSRKQINQSFCYNGILWPTKKSTIFLVSRRTVCATTPETSRLSDYCANVNIFVHITINNNKDIL